MGGTVENALVLSSDSEDDGADSAEADEPTSSQTRKTAGQACFKLLQAAVCGVGGLAPSPSPDAFLYHSREVFINQKEIVFTVSSKDKPCTTSSPINDVNGAQLQRIQTADVVKYGCGESKRLRLRVARMCISCAFSFCVRS